MGKKLTLNVNGIELTKQDIKERFDKYNSLYFNGVLGKCDFCWYSVNQTNYGGYIAYETENGVISKIWIGRNTYWDEEKLKEILVHEMIHMYVRTIDNKKIDGILGHGRHFRRQCKRIKKEHGLIIHKHPNFGYIKKELNPKKWEKVLLWLIDW